ncbi:hypothetical protein JTE90_015543 [Oedothorax gibbosus]|uniref:Uncharacterized protein n=1 Tax=Oedothorax gibbosus TaxID=931172 RepID=A0AAV6TPC6_9ARAC|nr:hypothetical protein JTE90_015543 [Oedothorax gibbosus]
MTGRDCVDDLTRCVRRQGFPAMCIHGNKSQQEKDWVLTGSTSAIPRKGTLKRKRWLADALKEKNKSYEDDIFENQKFASPFRIPTEADDESDTSIATPKFGFFLTPAVAKRTPKFKDIISPSNLVKARKNAEEYLYRRQNRNKKNKIISLKTPASSLMKAPTKLGAIPEKKKLEFAEAMDKMRSIKSTIAAKDANESDAKMLTIT